MDWLEEELGAYEDDYLIIDCPGTVLDRHTFPPRAEETFPRPNRTVLTSSVPAETCPEPTENRNPDVRGLSCRITVHGGQI